MKHYFFILLMLIPAFLFAQDENKKNWEKANAFYTTGEYQQAIPLYEQIINNGYESAKLYYNLGNAYYKTGNINNAILNYERAKLLAPQDKDIDFNLQIANQFTVTNIEPLPQPFFLRWQTKVVNKYPADTWAAISIGAFVAFLLLLGLFFLSRRVAIRRFAFWLGIVTFIFSGFTFSFAAKQKTKQVNSNHAIVFCPRVTVKSSPAQNGTDLFLYRQP